ncbi:carboxypeptidase-like regulatory domain-containing protein [Arcticibacter sp. MXS-1]|uniref:carboxypeptidase-like regulatory domain-containing protein n=1 Tax=Arcticibacter sp. MXS-1 TaxID=3341726 RepID=UPI0035A852A5
MKFFHLFYLTLLLCAVQTTVYSQRKVTVSGYLKDAVSGESLAGALVSSEGTSIKASGNSYGFYSLSLQPGKHTVAYSYIGYQRQQISFTLSRDTTININLVPASNVMNEVVVSASTRKDNVTRPINVTPLVWLQ